MLQLNLFSALPLLVSLQMFTWTKLFSNSPSLILLHPCQRRASKTTKRRMNITFDVDGFLFINILDIFSLFYIPDHNVVTYIKENRVIDNCLKICYLLRFVYIKTKTTCNVKLQDCKVTVIFIWPILYSFHCNIWILLPSSALAQPKLNCWLSLALFFISPPLPPPPTPTPTEKVPILPSSAWTLV